MQTSKYLRKQFPVNAIQVTEENMEEVAAWCKGELITTPSEIATALGKEPVRHIKLDVPNARDERQTQAFAEDWALYDGRNFKFFTDRAFKKSFDKADESVRTAAPTPAKMPAKKTADKVVSMSFDTEQFDALMAKAHEEVSAKIAELDAKILEAAKLIDQEKSGSVEWDIDANRPMSETIAQEKAKADAIVRGVNAEILGVAIDDPESTLCGACGLLKTDSDCPHFQVEAADGIIEISGEN